MKSHDLPALPTPAGTVNMQTPSGCPNGIKWTEWAQPHDSPLFTVAQMEAYAEEALLKERDRCMKLALEAAYDGCHEFRRKAAEAIAGAISEDEFAAPPGWGTHYRG